MGFDEALKKLKARRAAVDQAIAAVQLLEMQYLNTEKRDKPVRDACASKRKVRKSDLCSRRKASGLKSSSSPRHMAVP